jgi:hypothetical protein
VSGERLAWKRRGDTAVFAGIVFVGGLGCGFILLLFAVFLDIGAIDASYFWPGDAEAARLTRWAGLGCLVAAAADLVALISLLRRASWSPSWWFGLAGGLFVVSGVLSLSAAATATHKDGFGPLGIVCLLLALLTPWWIRWLPKRA